jgi:hypothetical protein
LSYNTIYFTLADFVVKFRSKYYFSMIPDKASEPHARPCEYCDVVNFQTLGAFLEMFSLEWEVTLENNYLLHFNTGAQMAQ